MGIRMIHFKPYIHRMQNAIGRLSGLINILRGYPYLCMTFHTFFLDQQLSFTGGEITKGTSLDTLHQLTLPQLRGLFLASLQQFDKAAGKFKDSCFKAEFGYYDLNIGVSYASEVLVKAWRITPLNSVYPSEYPIAYYQDNGKLILYDNGIQASK